MKAFYSDADGEWHESTRDGPWEHIFTSLDDRIGFKSLEPFYDEALGLCWKLIWKNNSSGGFLETLYRWDWEGDASLALREAIYAAQLSAAAS